MSGKTWTEEEDKVLTRLYEAQVPRRDMVLALGRSYKAIDSRIFKMQEMGELEGTPRDYWWRQEGLRIGFLDIETSNLKANAGEMLSWAIKVRGEDQPQYGLITQKEMLSGMYDYRILLGCIEELVKLDAVVTFFGSRFDIPFLRTRCMSWDLPFPEYGTIWHWDLFYAARKKVLLHRKSLDALTSFIGVPGKTHLDMEIWWHARHGHRPSLEYVMEHNIADVLILEDAFTALEPYSKWTRTSI